MQAKLMQAHTPTAPREGRATYVVPTGHQEYCTVLRRGGNVEVVITPGWDVVLIVRDASGQRIALDLTEDEAFDVAHNLARRA
jgi:hypothetical protein